MDMRRAFALFLLAAAATVAPACSGADAQEAQQLLAQSDAAFANVKSATFTARMTMTGGPADLTLTMTGGGYAKGKRAGDFYLLATAENLPFRDLVMLKRAGRVSMSINGSVVGQVPMPSTGEDNPLQVVDISQYVKEVRVEHGKLIDGEPMTKVSGVIDTAGLVHGALRDLTGAGGNGIDFSGALGDTRVVLYISAATHLPMRGLVDMAMKVSEQKIQMHLDFAYTSYDEKLEFPGLT
ncbi:MAG TPA: hypothetical protein VGJ34_04530 [Gaiellaceae bacterium]|jgi:hypothetical protein